MSHTVTSNGFAAAIQLVRGTPLIPDQKQSERSRENHRLSAFHSKAPKEQANCLLIHKDIKNRVSTTVKSVMNTRYGTGDRA